MTAREEEQRLYGALTSEQVAALDRAAAESGVSVVQLMEIAGWQVARCGWLQLRETPGRVFVLAGRGNNGGDGLVAARHLRAWGCTVDAHVLADEESLGELLGAHVRSAAANGVHVTTGREVEQSLAGARGADIVLDGLLGTGLREAPRHPAAAAIAALNAAQSRILAIDVPSGLDASTGQAFEPCIRATWTCTLGAMKAGLWQGDASVVAGDVWVGDIGMPLAAWQACGLHPPDAVRGGALLPVPSTS